MVIIEAWFISSEGITVISVVVLQNIMDLLNGELGSCDETRVTDTLDGKEVIGIEAERVSDVAEGGNQETTTIPAINSELNISCVPVVSVTHISYRLYPEFPAVVPICLCKTKI